jgi:tRNA(adenine34) deaminase
MMEDHPYYMRRAMELARNVPHLPFGALIVSRSIGKIVAEGWNRSSENPTRHGEIDAINNWYTAVAQEPDGHNSSNSELTLYTTAEPCPMCIAAILWADIDQVVYGTSIPTLQRLGWRQMNLRAVDIVARSPAWKCEVIGGVMESECDRLFADAIKHRT